MAWHGLKLDDVTDHGTIRAHDALQEFDFSFAQSVKNNRAESGAVRLPPGRESAALGPRSSPPRHYPGACKDHLGFWRGVVLPFWAMRFLLSSVLAVTGSSSRLLGVGA